ncbi:Thymosin beta-like 2 [Homarus americanus]|uniref:Thymosin beta-like 2 n=1 Tax=Homarus americanus TaxID=6706 RepID=A0A8J5JSC8_HOMAM|nr:Thymosin beta-like 2 [Homarus americanus]
MHRPSSAVTLCMNSSSPVTVVMTIFCCMALHGVVVSDVEAEKQAIAHLQAVEGFNAANLKHANTQEKVVLPAKEDIVAEKGQQALRQGIEGFNPSALKRTETQEKNKLPTKEEIEQEKKA